MAEQTASWTIEDARAEAQKGEGPVSSVLGSGLASTLTGPFERLLGMESGIRQPETSSLPPGMEPAIPGVEDVTQALGTGITQGLLETAPVVGAVGGGMLGLKYGSMLPIPGSTFIGGALGTGIGYFAGTKAEQAGKTMLPLTRDDLQAYREAGKTFGAGTTMLLPFGLAGRAPQAGQAAVQQISNSMPQTSVEWIKAILQQPLTFYRNRPIAFVGTETAGNIGAATGAGLYESDVSPGERPYLDSTYRMGAEMLGGMLAGFVPSVFLTANADSALGLLQQARARVSPEARKQMASDYLFRLYERAGRDPEAARKMLEQENPLGMTAAQLTGFKELSALENTLIKGNAQAGNNFSREVETRGRNALRSFYGVLNDLVAIGTPEALREAAKLRTQQAMSLIEARFELAHKNAADAVAKITRYPNSAQARADYGSLMKREIDAAIDGIREHEQGLWDQAMRSALQKTPTGKTRFVGGRAQPVEIDPTNTLRAYFDMQAADPDIAVPGGFRRDVVNRLGLTPEDLEAYRGAKLSREALRNNGEVPAEMIMRIDPESGEAVPFGTVNATDLLNLRSQILRDLRTAKAQGDRNRVHFLGELQSGIMRDLESLPGKEFDTARSFSKHFNDFFTRTFADDVNAVERSGAERIAPEILADRVFGTGRIGSTLTGLRMRELDDAMGFALQTAQQRYADAVTNMPQNPSQADLRNLQTLEAAVQLSQGRVASVSQANARLLQMMATEAVDDTTGVLNPDKLARFVDMYRPALDQYGLTQDLENAESAQRILQMVKDPNSYINRAAQSQTALANVLSYESPIKAVEAALAGKFPVRDLRKIARLAKKGGPDAIDGLRRVIFDIAFLRADGPKAMTPPKPGEKTVDLDIGSYLGLLYPDKRMIEMGKAVPVGRILAEEGIISFADLKNMRKLLVPIQRVQEVMNDDATMVDLLKTGSLVNDFAVKVGGARLGSLLSAMLPGPGNIQTPGFGSQLAQSLLLKEPNIMVKGLIEQAMLDPKFQAELLAVPRSQREKFEMKRRLHAYMLASGLTAGTFDDPEPVEEAPLAPRPQRPTMFRPAPSTRGVPGLTPPGQQPPAPGSQGAAPGAPSQSRAMLQSLFPFDTISGMAAQQPPPPG